MKNPWIDLANREPFALQDDLCPILRFNQTADDVTRIHLNVLPEPFIGLPDASVVLLNLNPGFSEEEVAYHHLDEYFRNAALANLSHTPQPYPFYFLDPAVSSPGHRWWQSRLRTLLERVPVGRLSQRLLCVEYFPYHSARFSATVPRVPSQEYSFQLVRDAVARGAVIIAMRALRSWRQAVPELESTTVHSLNSAQSVYITSGNCPTGFPAALAALG